MGAFIMSAQTTDNGRERTRQVEVNNDAVKTGTVGKGNTTDVSTNRTINNTVNETPANRRSNQPHQKRTDNLTTEPNSKGNEKGVTPKRN